MADGSVQALKKARSMATPIPPPDQLGAEIGTEGNLPFSGWSSDGEVSRDALSVPIDEIIKMCRQDGQARSLLSLLTLPLLSAFRNGEWVLPEGQDGGEEEVEFANLVWTLPPQSGGMSSSRFLFLKKALQALKVGFSVFEEVHHVPESGPLAGKISIRKLAYRDPSTVKFKVDDSGGFAGIRQVATVNGSLRDVFIPKEKVWFWTSHPEENPFYGVSSLESAYYHFDIKRKLYYIAHLAAQAAAVPGRVGQIPHGASPAEVAQFKLALSQFSFNTSMTHKEGFGVTPFNSNSGFDFLKLIDHHNLMMSKSILASFLDSEQRATLIEVGRVDPSSDFFVMALEGIMDDLAESWSTHIMPKLINWNFGTEVYPVFKFGPLSDAARGVIKEIFQSVVTSSVLNSTPEFVRELEKKLSKSLGLGIDYEEIAEQEKQAAEQQALQSQEQQALQAGTFGQPPPQDGPAPPQEGPPQPQEEDDGGDIPEPFVEASHLDYDIDGLVAAAQRVFLGGRDFSLDPNQTDPDLEEST